MYHRRIPIITVAALVAALAVPSAASADPFTNAFRKIGRSVSTAAQKTGAAVTRTAQQANRAVNNAAVKDATKSPRAQQITSDLRIALSLSGVYLPPLPSELPAKTSTTTTVGKSKPDAKASGIGGGKGTWDGKTPVGPAPTPTPAPSGKDKKALDEQAVKSKPYDNIATAREPGQKVVSAAVGTTQRVGGDGGLGQPGVPPAPPKETEDTADQTRQANESFDRLMDLLNQMHNTRNTTAGRVAGS